MLAGADHLTFKPSEIWVLEGSADVILLHDPIGHRGFLAHVLRCGLRRAGRG